MVVVDYAHAAATTTWCQQGHARNANLLVGHRCKALCQTSWIFCQTRPMYHDLCPWKVWMQLASDRRPYCDVHSKPPGRTGLGPHTCCNICWKMQSIITFRLWCMACCRVLWHTKRRWQHEAPMLHAIWSQSVQQGYIDVTCMASCRVFVAYREKMTGTWINNYTPFVNSFGSDGESELTDTEVSLLSIAGLWPVISECFYAIFNANM